MQLSHVRGPICLQVHLDAGDLFGCQLRVVGQDLKAAWAAIFVPVLDNVVVFGGVCYIVTESFGSVRLLLTS